MCDGSVTKCDAVRLKARRPDASRVHIGRTFTRSACFLLLATFLLLPTSARADDAGIVQPLRWDPAWTHAGPLDYVFTGIGLAGLGLEYAFLQWRQTPLRSTGPILFDEAARDALHATTVSGRQDAEASGWALMGVVTAYPVVVDIPYVWTRYGSQVAWDLFWQDATALSLVTAADLALRDIVGRARPSVSACLAAGGTMSQCMGTNIEAARSFPGGHMAIATTGASLLCTQHLSMHLYGAPWDAIACATAVTTSAVVGTLRIVSDDHWASDVLVGAALGVAVGWGVPVLMHLRGGSKASTDPKGGGVLLIPFPFTLDHATGIGVTGLF